MDRRSFLAALAGTAAGLVLPYEPRRIYSFGSAVGVVEVPRVTIFKCLTPGPTTAIMNRSLRYLGRINAT